MKSKVIAILNQKGGVGKTTTTINLAAYLAKSGKSVLIVDSDPQGNATSGLGLDKSQSLTTYNVLLGEATLRQTVISSGIKGVDIVPANNNLAGAELELKDLEHRESRLKSALFDTKYDFVLIDCPPALSLLTVNALVASNWLLVPVQAEFYALEGLGQLMEVYQRIKQSINTDINLLGVLVTMYDNRTSLSEQVKSELMKYFGENVFQTNIPRNVRLAEAPSYGKPISEHDKWSKGAKAYKQFTKEVINRVKT